MNDDQLESTSMNGSSNVEIRRNLLRNDPDCRFVSLSEYVNLMISRLPLQRSYDYKARVAILTDTSDSTRFLIGLEELANYG